MMKYFSVSLTVYTLLRVRGRTNFTAVFRNTAIVEFRSALPERNYYNTSYKPGVPPIFLQSDIFQVNKVDQILFFSFFFYDHLWIKASLFDIRLVYKYISAYY